MSAEWPPGTLASSATRELRNMPLFGAHKSIAGGYYKAIEASLALGGHSLQMFTRNNTQWRAKPITPEEALQFRQALKKSKLRFPMAHDSYLINLGSPDAALYRKSIDAFVEEVERAELLGLSYLVTHPGCPTDGNEATG